MIIICSIFIPNSPRWLLSKDRDEDAIASLHRLRPKEDALNGKCEAEISEIRQGLREVAHKSAWIDLIRGSNLRRTSIVIVFYFFQQVGYTIPTPLQIFNQIGHWTSIRINLPDKILPAERVCRIRLHLSPCQ